MKKNKYKSGLSKYIYVALVVYHIMIILPFILVNFLKKDVITWYAYVLMIIDILYLLPLLFNTYCSLEDTYLFVNQWPLAHLQIYYNDIFIIDTELPADVDKKLVKKFHFTKKYIVIGYYGEVVDKKDKRVKRAKKYITVSPKELDEFMVQIGSNFSSAKSVAEKIEKTLKENEEKHKIENEKSNNEKRKQSDDNSNNIIVSKKKKTKFKIEDDKQPDSSKEDNKQ